jgi:soluble lytic murein transglycosylase-like protein
MGGQHQGNEPRARARLARIMVVVLLACAITAPVVAQEDDAPQKPKVYQHRDKNGTRTFSDLKRIKGHSYLGEYGRPTATASCRGYSPERLEARGADYDHLFAGHAQAYNLEPALVKAVARVESCFDVRAVSRVGAQGLMQLMPSTASMLGVSDSFKAEQNIGGGAAYLRAMLDRFGGNMSLALAAYNAGPAAVEKYSGIPPYRETIDYVKKVTAQYQRYVSQKSQGQLTPVTLRVPN